jgi:phosphopantetheinyl transferase
MIFLNRHGTQFGLISKANISQDTFLFPEEHRGLRNVKHPSRRYEFIGIRQLRNKMIPNQEIIYLPSGKPALKDSVLHISISHSAHTICLGVSEFDIGLDIEAPNDRILRIISKFCSKEETSLFNEQSVHDMTLLWTLKEAAYKKANNPGLDFKKEIKIIERTNNNQHLCRVSRNNKISEFKLAHEEIQGQILTYTT